MVTMRPMTVSLRNVDLDVYWENGMVANIFYGDETFHVTDEPLIRRILNDNGITESTYRRLAP